MPLAPPPSESADLANSSERAAKAERWQQFLSYVEATNPVVPPRRGILRFQRDAQRMYNHKSVQLGIAALIFANFFANILEAQIDPFGREYPVAFLAVEDTFNYIFLVELIINAYAHWFALFIASKWNWFDVLVVFVGVLSIARVSLPGPFALLRMLRAFRVFRLFKRIKSLQKVIIALLSAVPGMLNAGFINVLIMCIYAIIGVEYFGEFGKGDEHTEEDGAGHILNVSHRFYVNMNNASIESVDSRGLYYGDEYFGTFSRASFTLFQVLTGESWSEIVARPVVFGQREIAGTVYYTSYILLNAFVLINIVIGVLLEKCLTMGDLENHPDDVPLEQEHRKEAAAGTAMVQDMREAHRILQLLHEQVLAMRAVRKEQRQQKAPSAGGQRPLPARKVHAAPTRSPENSASFLKAHALPPPSRRTSKGCGAAAFEPSLASMIARHRGSRQSSTHTRDGERRTLYTI
ncbi:hypothetical protein AB1Y20_020177 [Prymnesium parvum]|uniref:Ion transport domain-containing protein n=1 Tax=Prymnesium parvum TaxID=97485 RepID=A0AB34JX69_PRYPA